MLGVEPQPDTFMPLAVSRTTPFRRLQARIGTSTYRLNTVLVGLESIARGYGDAGAIGVTWSKPTPDKAKQVADQARTFACASALVMGADVFDSFIREIANECWLGFADHAREIATKAKTRHRDHGGEFSVAERAEALCNDLGIVDPIRIAALDLLAKWRNVVAHSSSRSPRLPTETRRILKDAAAHIHGHYAHLDILLALRNFESRKPPVPKEATTLIAVAVNFSRQLDETAIKRAAPTEDKVCVVAERMLCNYFSTSDERPVTPWSELSDAWQGSSAIRRNSMLKKFLANAGMTESSTPVSAPLPARFLEEITALSRDEFAQRFKIPRPH
jgi:hypothetical protein